jgi:peptidoglycan/LPS O-acetylase OafA/YrhL
VESPLPPLLVAWTLFYEVKFYLAFGVLIWNRALGIGVFAVWLVYLAASYRFGLADPFRLWTLWNAHFFLGCGAYWLYRRFGQSGVGQGMSGQVPALGAIGLGLGGLALSVALTDFRLEPIDGSNNEVVVLIALSFALVIAGMARADALLAPWCGRGLRYLGDASYSLYLVHSAVISLCFIVAARVPALARLDPVLTYFGVAVLAVAGAAWRTAWSNGLCCGLSAASRLRGEPGHNGCSGLTCCPDIGSGNGFRDMACL